MSRMAHLYEAVTANIIAELEAGAAPWVKPWKAGRTNAVMPVNAATGRAYSGINIPILWQAASADGYPTHRWMTFRQASAMGGKVRRGEHGAEVVLALRMPVDDDEDKAPRTRPLLRTFIVFNVAQIGGLPDESTPLTPPIPDSQLEAFVTATGSEIRIGGNRALYFPTADYISMPAVGAFTDAVSYYATILHELGHWTGHPTRLDRDLTGRFGSRAYAAEELVAEFTAAFLCADLGIRGELRHAAISPIGSSSCETIIGRSQSRRVGPAKPQPTSETDLRPTHNGERDHDANDAPAQARA